jgi:cell division septation protein DedD
MIGAAYVALTAVVFFLGIWVGRDVATRHPPETKETAQVAAPARPAADSVPRPVDEKFFDKFREELYNSLEDGESTPGATAPEATATAGLAATAGRTQTAIRATATPERRGEPTRTATRPRATPTPKSTATSKPTKKIGPGSWVIQVGSTRNGTEAFEWSMRLRSKGFSPHTDESPSGGTTWFRVRLGPFATREEAVRAYQRLTGSTEFQDAYITTK